MEKTDLKKRRERLGLTQTSFAETIGISANTVSRYETGTMVIPKYMDLVLEALETRQIKTLQTSVENN
jgi:transcriptional regulator with XRE-family HTH domain